MELVTKNPVMGIELPIYIDSEELFSSDNHGMYRLVFIESGTGILTINQRSIVFMAPAIFCLNELDEICVRQSSDAAGRVIYFNPEFINNVLTYPNIRSDEVVSTKLTDYQDYFLLRPFIERSDEFLGKFDITLGMEKRLGQLLDHLKREAANLQNEFWPCRTRSFFLEILFLIQYIYTDMKQEEDIQITDILPEIGEVILYLHKYYERKITINELENTFHMNRTTLSEKFSKATRMSIMEYLINLRVKIAAMMLRDTLLPISEIMYRVGFSDSTHFNRTFKKHYALSPSEYRKQTNSI